MSGAPVPVQVPEHCAALTHLPVAQSESSTHKHAL
jgi:hypothetical protein